ncbi:MAG: 16S rRNA (cytidine(1402)-2'-O)-methyltransferase [Planctomycetota bacterium]|jgi:16S rRNA (cytidine1402-2'-O)-methyltransferase|nr:16S rRNA (cytidine(1402)-2'-O)-methyltransferase [Planctomycetota bacterium]
MQDVNPPEPGIYLVATPIGNMEDITLRALRILRSADILACEDTRVTRKLFERHGLAAPRMIFSCHDHNERMVAKRLADLALSGSTVACCSDAGMPGISDPGFHIVREALGAGVKLEAIPGPNAMVTAATLSGLAGGAFTFFGFPSRRDGRLRSLLRRHGRLEPALVFHESPRRLARLLTLAAEIAGGGRRAAICFELTKKYERVIRGSLEQLAGNFGAGGTRGEAVVVIEGNRKNDSDAADCGNEA